MSRERGRLIVRFVAMFPLYWLEVSKCAKLSPRVMSSCSPSGDFVLVARSANRLAVRVPRSGFLVSAQAERSHKKASSLAMYELMFSIRNERIAEWVAKN